MTARVFLGLALLSMTGLAALPGCSAGGTSEGEASADDAAEAVGSTSFRSVYWVVQPDGAGLSVYRANEVFVDKDGKQIGNKPMCADHRLSSSLSCAVTKFDLDTKLHLSGADKQRFARAARKGAALVKGAFTDAHAKPTFVVEHAWIGRYSASVDHAGKVDAIFAKVKESRAPVTQIWDCPPKDHPPGPATVTCPASISTSPFICCASFRWSEINLNWAGSTPVSEIEFETTMHRSEVDAAKAALAAGKDVVFLTASFEHPWRDARERAVAAYLPLGR
jgi:hypothetical protein